MNFSHEIKLKNISVFVCIYDPG